jgi:hypothetical protein
MSVDWGEGCRASDARGACLALSLLSPRANRAAFGAIRL